ncbi:MAG: AMP-binding protein [Flavobacteriaceae bacterium]
MKKFHPDFRLNGFSLTQNNIYCVAYDLIKEGQEHEKKAGLFFLEWFNESPDITLKTSGTTGAPKEITVAKQAMIHSALATGEFFDLYPKDKILCCMPVNFIAGKMMFVRAFVLGLELDFVAPSLAPLLQTEKEYDFCAMTPMQVENSLEELHRIKKLIIGGAKVSPDLEEKLQALSVISYETYASTETLSHIAARKTGKKYFELLPDISITTDSRGCLIIDAPRISPEKITTNDLVEIKSEKEFIWLGRVDNVVNSGGIKLFPESIENKLFGKITAPFFVGGIPDSVLGEKLVLVIEAEKYELPATVFEELEKYEKPKEVFFIPKFPLTESGKIKRNEILSGL